MQLKRPPQITEAPVERGLSICYGQSSLLCGGALLSPSSTGQFKGGVFWGMFLFSFVFRYRKSGGEGGVMARALIVVHMCNIVK